MMLAIQHLERHRCLCQELLREAAPAVVDQPHERN